MDNLYKDVDTLVLRFRDLVTAAGDTIRLHRERCEVVGYTWWGWWHRANEVLPYSLFVRLKFLSVTGGSLQVYLFDSVTKTFYEAKCIDIHFGATPKSAQPSPNPEATPEYYRSQKYMAWFKLTQISEHPIPDTMIIGKFSYVPILDAGDFDYSKLKNKSVASTRELVGQNRTVFFLRASAPDQRAEEVLVLPPVRVFLCHSSGDKAGVRELCKSLKDDSVSPWLDEENLLPGQDWEFEILKAVRESDVVVVCLSNAAVNKEGFLQKELRYALDVAEEKPEGTIFLIPLKLEPCDTPQRLKRWQYVELFHPNGYDKLLSSIAARARTLGGRLIPRKNTYEAPGRQGVDGT